jgi:hypothetical protein
MVKVQLQVTGMGFEEQSKYGHGYFGGQDCEQRTIDSSCDSLAPGHSCTEEIDFSPQQSGTSHGHLEVLATGPGKPISRIYDLVAAADYPPELVAIDGVIKRHRDELMRIPHVVRVSIDDSDNEIIEVEVAHEEDIPQVERSVPPKLEGYRVEVIEEIARGVAM